MDKSRETADSEKSLRGIPRAVLALPSVWKPAIRESREARLEAALVFNKPSEELVDFFRVAACFLADFALKGPFLVFLARLFLNTFPVPFFFKGLDFFHRATCFFEFCIFTGILAAFMERRTSSWCSCWQGFSSCTLLEEGLLEFSIFAVQGAADLTSVFFKGQSWNE